MEISEILVEIFFFFFRISVRTKARVEVKIKWCSVEDAEMLILLQHGFDAQQKWPHVSDNREEKGLCPRLHGTDRLLATHKSLRNKHNVSFSFKNPVQTVLQSIYST